MCIRDRYLDSAYFENVGEQAAVKNCRENEINYTAFEDGNGESMLCLLYTSNRRGIPDSER